MPEITERVNEELGELLRVADLAESQTGYPGAIGAMIVLCAQALKLARAARSARLHTRRD